jgi:hypothetical protein
VYASEESKIRYEAYSRLQATASAFGESVPVPEIVAVRFSNGMRWGQGWRPVKAHRKLP